MGQIEKHIARARAAKQAKEAAQAEAPMVSDLVQPQGAGLDIASLRRVTVNPHLLRENRLIVDEKAPSASAYKMLRTRVLQRMRRNEWSTLAVTGLAEGEVGDSLSRLRRPCGRFWYLA